LLAFVGTIDDAATFATAPSCLPMASRASRRTRDVLCTICAWLGCSLQVVDQPDEQTDHTSKRLQCSSSSSQTPPSGSSHRAPNHRHVSFMLGYPSLAVLWPMYGPPAV
jgi:hypothetical protein